MRLSSGGYALSGETDGFGAGSDDFILFTVSEDFKSCGNLIANEIALQHSDVTNDADLLFQDIALTEDFSYSATIPYNPVTPTVSDILLLLSEVNGKDICPLVGQSSSAASPASPSSDCGCSVFGVCNSAGNCECQDGYSGFACSYSATDYLSLTTQSASEINSLPVSVGIATD